MIRQEIPSFFTLQENLGNEVMGIAEDMKKLAEEIVSSYKSQISAVGIIIDNVHHLLEDFKTERGEISNQLKETLAKGKSLRKKDFDNMMKDILSRQEEREKQVRDLLKAFLEEQKETAEIIKKNLAEGEKVRINDFKKMLQDIQAKQEARENEVTTTLKKFQKEYKEMAESLRNLLNKGEAIRVKDFKEMIKNIRSRQIERANEVRERLNEFRKERQYSASYWHKTTEKMAKKRAERLKGDKGKRKEEVTKI